MFSVIQTVWNKPFVKFLGPIVISLFLGFFLGSIVFTQADNTTPNDTCAPDLDFVKPEQDCEQFQDTTDRIQAMEDMVKRQVNGYLKTSRAEKISVFVRDLDSQKFAYINETDGFYMASLLKLPLAIAYLRLAELTPDLLTQRIIYDGNTDFSIKQEIKPQHKLAPGSYAVDELLTKALIDSDNNAAQLLSDNFVSYDYIQKILFTLGLPSKEDDQSQNKISPRTFAGIFRTLYNSSFLSREYSNKILAVLSKSSFTDGATALLPSEVKVSHKFAERSVFDVSGQLVTRQLHDCGIVYANKGSQPYSFCIMTEGKNFDDLKSVIQNVSKTIYSGIVE